MKRNTLIPEILFVICISFYACADIPQIGTIKNVTNGITSTYRNIIPEGVIRIMNGEVTEHSQVPLGESFEVISNGIRGLTVKDDHVKVGCELTISDKIGNILLNIPDLMETGGVFHKDSAGFLRCTVNTGSPMKWMERYDVEIRYWDKYGDGELINTLEVEIIDEP